MPTKKSAPSANSHGDVLDAGGLLPAGLTVESRSTEAVSARAYNHESLGNRSVVQLVGDTIAPGIDNEAALLGFTSPSVVSGIATGPLRGLGFPASILVHQPEHQAVALAVVDDMNRAARKAKSKPGHAKEAFDGIARKLDPPSLLPSFFEEAGRAFIAADALKLAAQMFEKARETERTYALTIDESARRDAFLEFAFAGALTAKSLANYASGLSDEHDPEVALEAFIDLAIRRTLGGLPPMTDTLKIVKRLAKATGRDKAAVAATESDLLELLLDAPATEHAPASFWKSVRANVVTMAKADDSITVKLLKTWPKAGRNATQFSGWWLELLTDTGAIARLQEGTEAEHFDIDPAIWLSRYFDFSHSTYGANALAPHFSGLIVALAPTIARGETEVSFAGRSGAMNAEAVDIALEAALAVTDSGGAVAIGGWLRKNDELRRPLEFVARDPRFSRRLELSVMDHVRWGHAPTLSRYEHFVPAISEALEAQVEIIETGLATDCRQAIGGLGQIGPLAFTLFPKLADRLRVVSVADMAVRQLRAGVADELGWAALDAIEDQGPVDINRLGNSWPVITVQSAGTARALDASGEIAAVSLPNEPRLQAVYIGGQFQIVGLGGQERTGFWSNDPTNTFKPVQSQWRHRDLGYVLCSDESLSTGEAEIRVGDTAVPSASHGMVGDGTHWWKPVTGSDYRFRWREVDPVTGQLGRESRPTWFDEAVGDGWEIRSYSSLMPLPEQLRGTPLGERDGMTGTRITSRPVSPEEAVPTAKDPSVQARHFVRVERIDGLATEFLELQHGSDVTVGLIDWPGRDEPLVIKALPNGQLSLWTSSNEHLQQMRGGQHMIRSFGSALHPLLAFWHHYRPRDPEGSQRLRSIDANGLQDVLAVTTQTVTRHIKDHPEPTNYRRHSFTRPVPDLTAIVDALRPAGITNARLATGVAGAIGFIVESHLSLQQFQAEVDEHAATADIDTDFDVPLVTEASLRNALSGLSRESLSNSNDSGLSALLWSQQHFCPDDNRYLAVSGDKNLRGPWPINLIESVGQLMVRASSPFLDDNAREALLVFLEVWATTVFCEDPESFFVGKVINQTSDAASRTNAGTAWRSRHNANTAAAISLLERPVNPAIRAVLPEDEVVERRRVQRPWGSPEQITEFVAAVRERGPVEWNSQAAEELARRTGLTTNEAKLLWAGCPGFGSWERHFLSAEHRKTLGLNSKEAQTARDSLRRRDQRRGLGHLFDCMIDCMVERTVDRWWQPLGTGPDDDTSPVAVLAATYVDRLGRSISIPEDALASAPKANYVVHGRQQLLAMLVEPTSHPILAISEVDLPVVEKGHSPSASMSISWLEWVLVYMYWAVYHRPIGDPLQAKLTELVDTIRGRLDEPECLLSASAQMPLGLPNDRLANLRRLGPEYAPFTGLVGHRKRVTTAVDAGSYIAVHHGNDHYAELLFRTAELHEIPHEIQAILGDTDRFLAASVLRGDEVDELTTRIRTTPVPAGEFEANPAASVPELVTEVASDHGLTDDAAAYYLQLLALMEPTDAHVKRWNGWTAARIRKAGATLVDAGLVLEAKRTRAGRKFFVGGRWIAAKSPHLPFEERKLEAAGLSISNDDHVQSRLPRWIERQPPHLAFARAYERAKSDPPAI